MTSEPSLTPYTSVPLHTTDEEGNVIHSEITPDKKKEFTLDKPTVTSIIKHVVIAVFIGVLILATLAIILNNSFLNLISNYSVLLDVFLIPTSCSPPTSFGSSKNLKIQLENIYFGTSSVSTNLNNATKLSTMRQRKWCKFF
jgi:hypothetical protein